MTIDARGISDDFAEEVDAIDAPALGEVGVLAEGEEESRCLLGSRAVGRESTKALRFSSTTVAPSLSTVSCI